MQLDGPDLEQLLVRARQEYGSDIRIVKADKVRTGGLGGFFAREHYEISIDVGEPADTESREQSGSGGRPISLLDLADAISDREQQSRQPQLSASLPFTPGISLGPALSTDGASFASILAGLTETVADDSASASKTVETAAQQENRAVVAVHPPLTQPAVRPPVHPRSRVATASPVCARDLRDLGLPRALLPASDDGDLLGALVTALRSLPPAPQPPQGAGEIFAVVGDGEGTWDVALELARSMNLDEHALVYLTAGRAPSRVAPARRITALEQLPPRLDRWRKRSTPTVAVIDAPMNLKAAPWNRQALTALDAAAVWLVVPATRKTDDVAQWANRLGRPDGLVVTDVDASNDPASVLQLGVPVAWLAGRPATPGAWAGLLVDRLVDAR
jgi:hypothetical protein